MFYFLRFLALFQNKRAAVVVVVDVFDYYELDEEIYAGIREVEIDPNSKLGITKVLK